MRKWAKTCNFCGTGNLQWGQVGAQWRLFDKGLLHSCAERDARVNAHTERVARLAPWAKAGTASVRPGHVRAGWNPEPCRALRPEPAAVEWEGFHMTPLLIAIDESRSKYHAETAATDTRRFNDMDVYPLALSGPEFAFN